MGIFDDPAFSQADPTAGDQFAIAQVTDRQFPGLVNDNPTGILVSHRHRVLVGPPSDQFKWPLTISHWDRKS
ncbi:MAG: hypothetical protein ACRERU_02900 [Methylococcales bacterium]